MDALFTAPGCIRLMVCGSVTHCGKTTACLSILGGALAAGLEPSEIAYIKPATQCEAPDLLANWTQRLQIPNISGKDAPLVFFSGFTRSFLSGEQGTSDQILERIALTVDKLAEGRRLLLIDGVGFPVSIHNADVALASQSPVVLIGKSGVGGAIDYYNLNHTYLSSKGVTVLGTCLNFAETEGMNSHTEISKFFAMYLQNNNRDAEKLYGVVPVSDRLKGLRERISETDESALDELADLNIDHFCAHVDVKGLLSDAKQYCLENPPRVREPSVPLPQAFVQRSREEVEQQVKQQGGKSGG